MSFFICIYFRIFLFMYVTLYISSSVYILLYISRFLCDPYHICLFSCIYHFIYIFFYIYLLLHMFSFLCVSFMGIYFLVSLFVYFSLYIFHLFFSYICLCLYIPIYINTCLSIIQIWWYNDIYLQLRTSAKALHNFDITLVDICNNKNLLKFYINFVI